jgi:hypothetical protein
VDAQTQNAPSPRRTPIETQKEQMNAWTVGLAGGLLEGAPILALAHHLELIRRGKIRRLIINAPPRSLKSLITSISFPAFMLGHDPSKRIIAISYGADLAIKHANDFRAVMNADFYQQLSQRAGADLEVQRLRRAVGTAA